MRLLYKMPLAIAAIVLPYFILMLGVQQLFIQPRFETLERASALRNLDRVTAAVNREALHLAILGRDWSLWDDTYQFVVSGSRSYVSTNFSLDSLKSSQADLVAIYDAEGRLRFEGSYDWSLDRELPANLLPARAMAAYPLVRAANPTDDITGFMDSPRGVMVVASTPILRTDGSGPPRGRFILGRLINSDFAHVISEQTSVAMELTPARRVAASDIEGIVAHGDRVVQRDASGRTVPAFGIIRDLWGAPVLVVQANTERGTSAWARQTMRVANALVYSFGLGLFVVLFFLLRRLVVRPLATIQGHLVRSETDDKSAVPAALVSRRDEIGTLASAFAHMEETLAARRGELQRLNDSLEAAVEARTGELRMANEDLRLMAKVFESTAESIVITDLDGKILQVNPAFCLTSGYREHELVGQNPRMLKSDRHEPSFYEALWKRLIESGSWSGEIWDRRKSGEIFPKWLTINAIRDQEGASVAYVGISSDITDVKQAEERLHQLAYFDPLTGLPNRSLFLDRMERCLARGQRYGLRVALLFIDLDHFKYVNDAMGHGTGDMLLAEVARRIVARVRRADTVCRIGGDEFTVILEQIRRSEDAGTIAQGIIEEIGRPMTLNGQEIFIGASIGISVYPYDDSTAEGLTRMADAAMYHAKTAGRNSFRFVSGQTDAASQSRLALESELRRAQDRGEFLLHYQPLLSIDGSRVLGAEALIRWRRSATGELVSPGVFIPLAEETGTILRMGEWVLRDACATAMSWSRLGLGLFVSVNVSPRQFGQAGLTRDIRGVLDETGLPPERLVIEITESTVMADAVAAERAMRELKEVGVSIAIDDFGTGYSSLSYLSRFPVDRLKIDQSFVRKIGDSAHADAIVSAIISMAGSLGLGTVAEGVETEPQRLFLEERGCREAQGFLFSKPVPVEAFLSFAETHAARRD